jgi:hypothetical protein
LIYDTYQEKTGLKGFLFTVFSDRTPWIDWINQEKDFSNQIGEDP